MDMEFIGIGTEEVLVGSCNNKTNDVDASHIAKGKRTKRLRPLSPCAVTAAAISSSSSASEEHGSGVGGDDYGSFSSTTTFESTDQEEEDMANCLILLAQGKRGRGDQADNNIKMRDKSSNSTTTTTNNNNNRRFSEVAITATTATTKVGFYIYECKTCNRTFPSFQALGGHRASHKKPKATPEEKKPQPQPQQQSLAKFPLLANCKFEETKQGHVMTSPPPISLQLGCGGSNNSNRGFNGGINKPKKVHECSICGSEFTSGQALGGHMRRHRASASTSSAPQVVDHIETSCDKPRNVLELDLNLPAPPEDDHHRDSKFHFTATQKSMVLSAAPALVGCHY